MAPQLVSERIGGSPALGRAKGRVLTNEATAEQRNKNLLAHTELLAAAQAGSVAKVSSAIKQGANVDTADAFGWTPLIWACSSGHIEVAQVLLNAKADVNLAQKDGRTPLMKAAERGHANIARMLVTTSGIDLNQNDSYGRTALSYAKDKRSGHENVASILTMAGAKG